MIKSKEHPLYVTHQSMKQRCYNPNNIGFHLYGGRGIKVCSRWLGKDGFWNFVADMGEKPEGMTLDRKNNDGDYSPDNCKWSTLFEQCDNRRDRINKFHYKGVSRSNRGFKASIGLRDKRFHLGCYSTAKQAYYIYVMGKEILKESKVR